MPFPEVAPARLARGRACRKLRSAVSFCSRPLALSDCISAERPLRPLFVQQYVVHIDCVWIT